jgi:hypothetical protein
MSPARFLTRDMGAYARHSPVFRDRRKCIMSNRHGCEAGIRRSSAIMFRLTKFVDGSPFAEKFAGGSVSKLMSSNKMPSNHRKLASWRSRAVAQLLRPGRKREHSTLLETRMSVLTPSLRHSTSILPSLYFRLSESHVSTHHFCATQHFSGPRLSTLDPRLFH